MSFLSADATGVALLRNKFSAGDRIDILVNLARNSDSEAIVLAANKELDRIVERNVRMNGLTSVQTLSTTVEDDSGASILIQERREALALSNGLIKESPDGNLGNPLARVIKPTETY